MCKITIIVPIYNVEKYLRECLDSLLNQTFKDIEILCMNDGSTDGSVQILEEYKNKDKRIRVINKKNSGYGATMNMGIDAANSEYIGIIESDDVAKPEMFENLYNLITKYNCDVVKSDFFLYYSKQNKLVKNNIMQGKIINKVTNVDEDIEILGICPSIWSCLYKKDFLLKNNIRFLETPGASYQDTSFYQKVILSAKKVFLTDNAYVQYRVDNENSSVNNRGKIYCITDEYKEIHKYIDKKAELKKYEQYIYMLQFNAYQWNIDRLAKNFKKEFFDYYYKEFCFLKDKGLLTNEFFSRAYYIDFDLFFNKPNKYYKKYVQPCKMKPIFEKIFSVTNSNCHKVVTILGMKFKFKNKYKELKWEIKKLSYDIEILKNNYILLQAKKEEFYNSAIVNLYIRTNVALNSSSNMDNLFNNPIVPYNRCYLDTKISYINYLFDNVNGSFDNSLQLNENPNFFYTCGTCPNSENAEIIASALKYGKKAYIIEDCFLRSIFSVAYKNIEPKYQKSIGFTIDDLTSYYDASYSTRLEQMLNDKNIVISDEQKMRAKKCIEKIISTHLSKYNNQPIFEPQIGRKGVKKVLVVDQSYGDMSISRGWGSEEAFRLMLEQARNENPDADIIVKTHPDTISGTRGGYYTSLAQHDNIYPMTEPINPISLIKYCDKVYVCTTQLGFEALMCGKEVHVFGMPFYAGWGLTHDRQKCERRTNTRTLEEVFYIAYIMYSYYVNPDKKCRCEIEEAMDYLLKLREEYFKELSE